MEEALSKCWAVYILYVIFTEDSVKAAKLDRMYVSQ